MDDPLWICQVPLLLEVLSGPEILVHHQIYSIIRTNILMPVFSNGHLH